MSKIRWTHSLWLKRKIKRKVYILGARNAPTRNMFASLRQSLIVTQIVSPANIFLQQNRVYRTSLPQGIFLGNTRLPTVARLIVALSGPVLLPSPLSPPV